MAFDVDHVLAEATTEELAALVCGSGSWHTTGIPRLGVPPLRLADGPHGLRVTEQLLTQAVPATCFPTAAGLGSSWNPALLKRVGESLAHEAIALGVDVVLGPGLNIKRSPLCGRNFEYFSEDPLLSGTLSAALVYGLQSNGVGGCLKHFAVNNQETDRMRVDAVVAERTLREIYLAGFQRAVTAAAPWMVMCSYNRVNGTLASQNSWLLTDVLRGDWDYSGVVVSDWGAVYDRIAALIAGLDLEMPQAQGRAEAVAAAVEAGELSREVLEVAAERLLALTDKAASAVRPAGKIGHHDLARQAALESMVLLRNDGVLPLAPQAKVALIGAFAATPRYQGSGSSKVNPRELDRLLDTLSARCDVTYAPGFRLSGELDDDLIDEALLAAEDAEVIVACLGLPDAEEAEGFDRTHMRIPENQRALVASLSEAGKPVVVVLSNGAAVEVADWVEETSALLEAWLGGEAGALALAQVLTGEAEPSGRLTETLGLRLEDYPSALMFPGESGQVMYGEGVFVGYRGFDALEREVAFPFGFGLGYTTFRYDSLTLTDTGSVVTRDVRVAVSVTLTNTGERAGAEVVQVYVRNAPASVSRPVRELRGYTKVWLEPGETRTVIVGLGIDAFAFWSTPHERFVVESGVYAIEAGPHSRDLPLSGGLRLDVPRLPSALHDESTIAEWFADTEAMEALQARAVARTGERFALSEQMYTVVAGQPLRRFAMFPGGVLTAEDVDAVLAEYGRSV